MSKSQKIVVRICVAIICLLGLINPLPLFKEWGLESIYYPLLIIIFLIGEVSPLLVKEKSAVEKIMDESENTPHSCRPSDFPFIGRKNEINQLYKFVKSEDNLSWISIVAPFGFGKTELILEFIQRLKKSAGTWKVAWLSQSDIMGLLECKDKAFTFSWNLLFVIESASSSSEIISDLIYKFEKSKSLNSYHVRFILIDHSTIEEDDNGEELFPLWYKKLPFQFHSVKDIELSGFTMTEDGEPTEDDASVFIQEYFKSESKTIRDDNYIHYIFKTSCDLDNDYSPYPRPWLILAVAASYMEYSDQKQWNDDVKWNIEFVIEKIIDLYDQLLSDICEENDLLQTRLLLTYAAIMDGYDMRNKINWDYLEKIRNKYCPIDEKYADIVIKENAAKNNIVKFNQITTEDFILLPFSLDCLKYVYVINNLIKFKDEHPQAYNDFLKLLLETSDIFMNYFSECAAKYLNIEKVYHFFDLNNDYLEISGLIENEFVLAFYSKIVDAFHETQFPSLRLSYLIKIFKMLDDWNIEIEDRQYVRADVLYDCAYCYGLLGKLNLEENKYNEALDKLTTKNYILAAKIYKGLARNEYNRNSSSDKIEHYLKEALNILESKENLYDVGFWNKDCEREQCLGLLFEFYSRNNLEKEQREKIKNKLFGNPHLSWKIMMQLCVGTYESGQYEEAASLLNIWKKYSKISLEHLTEHNTNEYLQYFIIKGRNDNAIGRLKDVFEDVNALKTIFDMYPDYLRVTAFYLQYLEICSYYYFSKKDFDSCIKYSKEAVAIAEEAQCSERSVKLYINLAIFYLEKRQQEMAKNSIDKAKEIYVREGIQDSKLYNSIVELEKKIQDFN